MTQLRTREKWLVFSRVICLKCGIYLTLNTLCLHTFNGKYKTLKVGERKNEKSCGCIALWLDEGTWRCCCPWGMEEGEYSGRRAPGVAVAAVHVWGSVNSCQRSWGCECPS